MRKLAVEHIKLTISTVVAHGRRVGRGRGGGGGGGAMEVRLEGSKDELTKIKNAKDESFFLICQRTQLFTV